MGTRFAVASSRRPPGQMGLSAPAPVSLRLGERGCGGFGVFVGVGGLGELAQGGVPVGFEGVGDEPVGGVDGEVAAAGLFGVVLGAVHGGGAQPVGVLGAGGEFVGDGEGGFQGEWGEGVDEELPYGGVDAGAGDGLADGGGGADAVVLADVVG